MIPGRRVEISLDDDGIEAVARNDRLRQGAYVGDVLERSSTTAAVPAPPSLKTKSGFPEHRRRTVESRFKQQKKATSVPVQTEPGITIQQDDATQSAPSADKAKSWEEEEKQRIDLENRQKLAQMSPEEIEEDRRELMNSLSPTLLQRLLQRANIDSGSAEQDLSNQPLATTETSKTKKSNAKTVSFAEPHAAEDANHSPGFEADNDDQEAPFAEQLPHDTVHFPRASQPPDLDPSSATFLSDLHAKYFPSLPSDPEKLEWMQPSSTNPTNQTPTYDPTASTLRPKDLRFSFRGQLIPPRTAAEIPVTAGLHHHGDAPDAAGYTIPELAHLAQSSYPAQRCIAFQTLGRVLYRLGKGEFGDSGEPGGKGVVGAEETFGELARGLWGEVEREKVVEILVRESEGKGADRGRHVSAKAYATEAVWLWRKGGGRRWKAY